MKYGKVLFANEELSKEVWNFPCIVFDFKMILSPFFLYKKHKIVKNFPDIFQKLRQIFPEL